MNHRKSKSEDCWQLMHKIIFVLQNACVIPKGSCLHRITFAQLRVLDIVCRHHPEGLMLKDITRELNQTAATTSVAIDTLVKNGFVVREQAEHDRRAVAIRLTPEGQRIRDDNAKRLTKRFDEAFALLSEEERKNFHTTLQKIWGTFNHNQEEEA